ALTNPPVLDMTLVKSKEALQAREEIIEDYITASKDLQDFANNVFDVYREELLKHKLTPAAREASLEKFYQSLRGINPTIEAVRAADVRRGKAMLKVARILKENWGKWEFKPQTEVLEFQG